MYCVSVIDEMMPLFLLSKYFPVFTLEAHYSAIVQTIQGVLFSLTKS